MKTLPVKLSCTDLAYSTLQSRLQYTAVGNNAHESECDVQVRPYTAYCELCRLVRPAGKQHGSTLMAQRHILRILRVQWRSLPELDGHAHSEGEPRRL